MLGNPNKWEKLGRIIAPDRRVFWMSTFTGASFAKPIGESSRFEIYLTARDARNRSQIGIATIDINDPTRVLDITPEPVFTVGDLGAFDENGVSYPCLVEYEGKTYMYYAGWMPTVLTPFQNATGMAVQGPDKKFTRVSRAPILERTDDDYLSTGSCYVLIENGLWRMWYTCFLRWGKSDQDHKHYYVIKYAQSEDGRRWERRNQICIDIQSPSEFSIGRPSVIKLNGAYHMWYSHRGEQYRIGYANSEDGISWTRRDDLAGIDVSPEGWDSKAVCYSHVFRYQDHLFMIYNGNHYGEEGLGIARMKL